MKRTEYNTASKAHRSLDLDSDELPRNVKYKSHSSDIATSLDVPAEMHCATLERTSKLLNQVGLESIFRHLEKNHVVPPSSQDEGLRLLHGLETNLATSLQTPQEA